MKLKTKNRKGFTLIELLVVISIISVLAAFLMANFINVRQRARDAQRKSDLKQIQSALELYRADNSAYPCFGDTGTICGHAVASGLSVLKSNSNNTVYMNEIPQDPTSGSSCPGYLVYINLNNYTIFANLDNSNDFDATRVKTAPILPSGSSAGKTFTVVGGTCNGSQYNYWVNNP